MLSRAASHDQPASIGMVSRDASLSPGHAAVEVENLLAGLLRGGPQIGIRVNNTAVRADFLRRQRHRALPSEALG